MKNIILLAIFMTIGVVSVLAQDTIVFRNGDELKVRVIEVNVDDVKYKLWTNQDGPTYTKLHSDIFMIKYSGGVGKEIFNNNNEVEAVLDYQCFRAVGLMSKGKNGCLDLDGLQQKNDELLKILPYNLYEMYQSAHKQYVAGVWLICVGSVFEFAGTIMAVGHLTRGNANDSFVGAFGVGLICIGTPAWLTGIPLVSVGSSRLGKIVAIYNRNSSADRTTLSISSSILSIPNQSGSSVSAFGVGMAFNF